ncbi:hypothetical protein H4R34_006048, partial [Dimargaris verticillata]
LVGHEGEVLTCQFDHSGQYFASGSADRTVLLWKTYGECDNYGLLKGHAGAVLDVKWTPDSNFLYTTSADKTLALWDCVSGERLRRWHGHRGIVNCCARQPGLMGSGVIASGSNDGTARTWDSRQKSALSVIDRKYPITALAYSHAGDALYIGGLDNHITIWDLRKQAVVDTYRGHTDTITGLAVHPQGTHLLSYAMDSTAHLWDARPYVPGARCTQVLTGAPAGFEKNLIKPAWSADGALVATGGGDRTVTLWQNRTGQILYKLPGHKGCVNQVHFHPHEPIVLSASSDRTLFLGEYNPDAQ